MPELPFRATLRGAGLAGLGAGLLVAAFHFVATEPLIDHAIALEEELAQAAAAGGEPPPVSRDAQRGGLVVGFLWYGGTWAMLFAVAFQLAQRWLPGSGAAQRGLLLALAGYWSVALFPFLKYPANPPGVGDPETITYRQMLYLGVLALSVLAAALAIALAHSVGRISPAPWAPWLAALAVLGAIDAVAYLLMPANPDLVRMPTDVVASFRVLSLVGLTLFWAILGVGFALLTRRAEGRLGRI